MNIEDQLPMQEAQPRTEKEEKIVKDAYRLLEIFDEKERETIISIKENRKIWEMKDSAQDGSKEGERVVQLPTLVANIESSVADQMDNMPDVQLLPEVPGGKETADAMADVLHYIFDRRNYKAIHKELMVDAHVAKACLIQTVWDDDLNDGKGDVTFSRWPIENFRWDPAFDDIQEGRACFKLAWYPKEWYLEHYPDKARYIQYGSRISGIEPDYQDGRGETITMLIEYWYRRYNAKENRYSIHVAKLAGGALLEYSEKDSPNGIYDHGMYPFDLFTYRKIQGTPVGRSMIDDFIDVQRRANRLSHYIDENARMSARFKLLVNEAAKIDMEKLMDWNQEVVPVNGRPDDTQIRQLSVYQLNPQVDNHMQWLLDIIKRESGQNNSARGEFGGGITAASAIQSLQEAGTKVSRMRTADYQQVFKSVATKVLWLAAQFYNDERVLVITGAEKNQPDKEITVDRKFIYGKPVKNRPLPAPPFTVQVVVQRSNPQRIDIENQWVLQISQMFAQNGVQVPVSSVIKMLTIPGKDRLLAAAAEIDARNDAIAQMQAAMEQAGQQLQQAQAENAALMKELQDAEKMAQGTAGSQMTQTTMPALPSTPNDPGAYNL